MTNASQKTSQGKSIYISQGEFAVDSSPEVTISTILGSCIAACIWDPVAKIGGMNHFLLPDGPKNSDGAFSSFGANAMELLINTLTRSGAQKNRLRAKVFGGAEMYRGLTDAGDRNGEFVLKYLKLENIPCDAQSLGGSQARRVEFNPASGRARQKLVEDARIEETVPKVSSCSDVELF
ncbi:chemotaxis protein CheD [Pacificibacter sp. AS14]|uniref:chemotaxis protein CheD n=1 Tax=Pacificibacter sp. AS14 TaxID=3135785 RepID=UPI00316F3E5C